MAIIELSCGSVARAPKGRLIARVTFVARVNHRFRRLGHHALGPLADGGRPGGPHLAHELAEPAQERAEHAARSGLQARRHLARKRRTGLSDRVQARTQLSCCTQAKSENVEV